MCGDGREVEEEHVQPKPAIGRIVSTHTVEDKLIEKDGMLNILQMMRVDKAKAVRAVWVERAIDWRASYQPYYHYNWDITCAYSLRNANGSGGKSFVEEVVTYSAQSKYCTCRKICSSRSSQ